MTSKARELANLGNAYSDGALSNRNLIINGAMQVAQRGTSHSVSAGYTLDRWFIASSVTATVTKEEDTVGGRKVSVIKSSASGSTYNAILQRIEGMRRIQGQTLTVSAWVKGAAGTETQYVEFRDSSGAVISNVTENFTFDGNWQKFEWTFEAPTNASFDNDAAWFNVSFYGGDELSVTMAQLEVGDTATPFEHRSYGDELQRCQRYYEIVGAVNGGSIVVGGTASAGGYVSYSSFPFAVVKRTAPTVAIEGTWTTSNVSVHAVAEPSYWGFRSYVVSSSSGDHYAQNYQDDSFYSADAEL